MLSKWKFGDSVRISLRQGRKEIEIDELSEGKL